jgi:anaerobic magnesium-protoporphyrin IX monomethyl ester cyclase
MRVTLIYAKSRVFKERAKRVGIGTFGDAPGEYARDDIYPPLGIASLAGVLLQQGYEVRIFDDSIEEEETLNEAMRWADVVGITALTSNARRGRELGHRARDEYKKFVVLGGPHPTVAPEYFLDDECCDITVQSEGDYVLPMILERKDRPETWDEIPSVTFKRNGKLVATPRRPFIKALDELPFPAYHLYDMKRFFERMVVPGVPFMSSRGCPYSCTFCDEEMTPRNYRAMSAKRTVDLMEKVLLDYKAPQIFFFDDLFTIQKKRVQEICEEIIRRQLFVEWSAESRVDTITFDMLRLMRKAGCVKLYYGLESGSPEQLVAIKKKVTQEGILKGAEITRQIGIYFKFFIIYGFPGETERDHRITESIVTKAMPHNIAVSLLCPHKGTEVYDQIKDRILHHPEEVEYGYWHQTEMWRHDVFSYDQLQAERERLISEHRRLCIGPKAMAKRKWERLKAIVQHPELISDFFEIRRRRKAYQNRVKAWLKDGRYTAVGNDSVPLPAAPATSSNRQPAGVQ